LFPDNVYQAAKESRAIGSRIRRGVSGEEPTGLWRSVRAGSRCRPLSHGFLRSEPLEPEGMVSMSSRSVDAPHPLGSPQDDRPAPVAGRPVRFSILGWAQAGSLAVLVAALVVLTSESTPHQEGAPAWAAPTGHPHWAVAFAPDGRRLATGGDD